MTKNTGSQKIGCQMVSATDGSAFTGSVTVAVTIDAGTQATGSVGSGACTHEGNGYHTYAPSQAETNGALIAFTFTGSGAIPATVQVFTTGQDFGAAQLAANVTQFGGSAGTFASGRPEVNTSHIAGSAVSTSSAQLGVNVVNWKGSAAAAMTGDAFARLGAPAGASVSADVAAVKVDTAAVKAKTDNLPASPAATGDIPTAATISDAVWDEATSGHATAGTTGKALTDAGAAGTPPTTAEIADAVWDEVQSGHTTAGTFGLYLDAAVSGVSTGGVSAADIADAVLDEALSGHTTAGSLGQAVSDILTDAAAILADTGTDGVVVASGSKSGYSLAADQSGVTVGTVNALGTQAKADVNAEVDSALDTAVPATPTANSINERVKALDDNFTSARAGLIDHLDADVSSRLATSGYTSPLDAAGVRTAVGLASANLDTQIAAVATQTSVDDLATDVDALSTTAATIDTDVEAIKATTDQLTFTVANTLDANVAAVNGVTTDVDKLAAHIKAVLKGVTTSGGSTTTIPLNTSTGINGGAPSAVDDFYNGRVVVFTSGALAGQATSISDYNGTTKVLTVVAMTGTPASGVSLVIV